VDNLASLIHIRGGGDLASGVALRLHRAGLKVLITEQPQPLAVSRLVSFAEAVYRGETTVEDVTARLVQNVADILEALKDGLIPVYVDPEYKLVNASDSSLPSPLALIDARMTKQTPDLGMDAAPIVIGLGPGFIAGENCHAAIETNRGHFLGRVIWQGATESDTGIPSSVADQQVDRVLRAPADGIFYGRVEIGSRIKRGQIIAEVFSKPMLAPFDGILRGLIHDGLAVERGMKVGALAPRNDPRYASLVSEKSLAIGGGVLEALLTLPEIRNHLCI